MSFVINQIIKLRKNKRKNSQDSIKKLQQFKRRLNNLKTTLKEFYLKQENIYKNCRKRLEFLDSI